MRAASLTICLDKLSLVLLLSRSSQRHKVFDAALTGVNFSKGVDITHRLTPIEWSACWRIGVNDVEGCHCSVAITNNVFPRNSQAELRMGAICLDSAQCDQLFCLQTLGSFLCSAFGCDGGGLRYVLVFLTV